MLNRTLAALVALASWSAFAQNDDFDGYQQQPAFDDFTNDADFSANAPLPDPQPTPGITSVDQFAQPLAPYGSWVQENGVQAFQPSSQIVGSDFVPYATNGQWAATTAGWEFQSSLPFGWATYHYGRWYQSPTYGWVWVPDTQWGPSWVEWRNGGGYTGWAPLAPSFVSSWHRPRWHFVESANLCNHNLVRYDVGVGRAWGLTASIPAYNRWYRGPAYNEWRSTYGRWRDHDRREYRDHGRPNVTVTSAWPTYRAPAYRPVPPPPTSSFGGGFHQAVPPPPTSFHSSGFGGSVHGMGQGSFNGGAHGGDGWGHGHGGGHHGHR